MGEKRCTHGTVATHKIGDMWVCSECGRRFRWDDKSSYYGNIECLDCGFIRVDAVACSDECRKKIPVS
jgi:DNA-directed RNA polymerase subunit RPC12/RpoP